MFLTEAQTIIAEVQRSELEQEAERLRVAKLDRAQRHKANNPNSLTISELSQKIAEKAGLVSEESDSNDEEQRETGPEIVRAVKPPAFPPPPRSKDG